MSDNLNVPAESWRGPRRRRQMDPQMVRMGVIAAGVVGVVALAAGSYALIGRRPHVVPVVEADSRPIRVRPENPGGATVEGADEQIMGGSGTGKGKIEGMAPPSEVPAPQALLAQIQASRPVAPPPAAAAAAIAKIDLPALEEPQSPIPGQRPAISSQPAQKVSNATLPATSAGSHAATATMPVPTADTAPVHKPVAAPDTKAAPDRVTATPGTGTMQVQLGALESEQAATTEWLRLSKRMPALLASRQPAVLRAEHGGKPIWRLRTGGFADTAAATAFCAQVRAKGVGCAIASF